VKEKAACGSSSPTSGKGKPRYFFILHGKHTAVKAAERGPTAACGKMVAKERISTCVEDKLAVQIRAGHVVTIL
jgi:hypothetical protein